MLKLGERIRRARKARGYSQSDLANVLNVSQPTIANWELGAHDPRQLMLVRLADVLGVSRFWLSSGERSDRENDRSAGAAYLRRPVQHVPIVDWSATRRIADDPQTDFHIYAEDYIPLTSKHDRLVAFFVFDDAVALEFAKDTLVIIDATDTDPADAQVFFIAAKEDAHLRIWREKDRLFAPNSEDSTFSSFSANESRIIGRVIYAVRFL